MEIEEKETEEEPKEEEKKEEENQEEKEDESEKTKEQEEVEETKPKTRMSFRLFKRKQTDKKAVKDDEKVVASEEPEEGNKEMQEDVEKEEGAAEEDKKETVKEDDKEDTQEQEVTNEPETEKTQEQEEMLEQASELNAKPKLRRSFNLFRRRPVSMSAADRAGTDKDEDNVLSRDDPIRHSYHAGDLPVPDPSNLRKYLHAIFWVWSYSYLIPFRGEGKFWEFYIELGKIEMEKSQGKIEIA